MDVTDIKHCIVIGKNGTDWCVVRDVTDRDERFQSSFSHSPFHLKTEIDLLSETLCLFVA